MDTNDGTITGFIAATDASELEYRPPGGQEGRHIFENGRGQAPFKMGDYIEDSVHFSEFEFYYGAGLGRGALHASDAIDVVFAQKRAFRFSPTELAVSNGKQISLTNAANDAAAALSNPGASGKRELRVGTTAGHFDFTDDAAFVFPKVLEGAEIPDPGPPPQGKGRLYFRDNGRGKTQLVVRFATGAPQVLAPEP